MKKQPEVITTCYLECLLMPQGEILSLGKTIGWFKDFKKNLTPIAYATGKPFMEKRG